MTPRDGTELLAVFTTVANQADADALGRAAVEQRLAACVQTQSIRSTYRWRGDAVCEEEVRLMFKTDRAHSAALQTLLRERHPYDLPAIFALTVAEPDARYAAWVRDSLAQP